MRKQIKAEKRPFSASFILTKRCNFKCKYCFENGTRDSCDMSSDMTKKVIRRGMKMLFDNAMQTGEREVHVLLFGGEPLLKPDLVDYLLTLGEEHQIQTKIRFTSTLTTNGSIMNDKIELMLHRHAARMRSNFTCQLSVDGAKESQNLYRVTQNGEDTFDLVEKNVATFKEIFRESTIVHACINKQTMPHMFENFKYFIEKWGLRSWFMFVHTEDWDKEDVKIYRNQTKRIFDYETKVLQTVSAYTPIDKLLHVVSGCGVQPHKTCGAGNSFISITPNGDIYPCHNIYFTDENHTQKCGNVFSNTLDESVLKPYHDYTIKDLGCEDCENTACYRCIADNFSVNGDITKQVGKPIHCALSAVEAKYQKMAQEYADTHFKSETQGDRIEKAMKNLSGTFVKFLSGAYDSAEQISEDLKTGVELPPKNSDSACDCGERNDSCGERLCNP